jgi:nitrite reductase (NADH) small subunit
LVRIAEHAMFGHFLLQCRTLMGEFLDLAGIDDVPLNSIRAFSVDGRRIAVYHVEKGYFASEDICPHRGGPLSEGDLIGGREIVCPWHLWSFDVATGCGLGGSDAALLMHEIKVDGDRLLVRLAPRREGSF